MDGSIDLSFEAIDDINKIPSTNRMGWVASELKKEDWTVALNTSAIEEIASMVKQTASKPLPTLLLKPEQFEIPELTIAFEKQRPFAIMEWGFAVIDKLPLDDFQIEEMVNVYWTLGNLMGPNVAQKWDGTMIYDVTDTGKKIRIWRQRFSDERRASVPYRQRVRHISSRLRWFNVQIPSQTRWFKSLLQLVYCSLENGKQISKRTPKTVSAGLFRQASGACHW